MEAQPVKGGCGVRGPSSATTTIHTHSLVFILRESFLSHLGPEDLLKDGQWTNSWNLHNSGAAAGTL